MDIPRYVMNPHDSLSREVFFSDFFPFLFLLIISVITLTPEPILQLNVCSLGWVIDSNTLRSVACVSLSFPASASRWDHWKESPTGTGSIHWRDPSVPVLVDGLSQRNGPLVGLNRPIGQVHIPM